MPSTLNTDNLLWHTIYCLCSKILNHVLNHFHLSSFGGKNGFEEKSLHTQIPPQEKASRKITPEENPSQRNASTLKYSQQNTSRQSATQQNTYNFEKAYVQILSSNHSLKLNSLWNIARLLMKLCTALTLTNCYVVGRSKNLLSPL